MASSATARICAAKDVVHADHGAEVGRTLCSRQDDFARGKQKADAGACRGVHKRHQEDLRARLDGCQAPRRIVAVNGAFQNPGRVIAQGQRQIGAGGKDRRVGRMPVTCPAARSTNVSASTKTSSRAWLL